MQRKGEHAPEPGQTLGPPGAPGFEDDLGIRAGRESRATRQKLVPDLDVVVYFAVEHDGEPSVVAGHRLAAAREVDDRKAPVPQCGHGSSGKGQNRLSFAIRSAMPKRVRHVSKASGIRRRSYPSRNATQRRSIPV